MMLNSIIDALTHNMVSRVRKFHFGVQTKDGSRVKYRDPYNFTNHITSYRKNNNCSAVEYIKRK